MSFFRYRARDRYGALVTGSLEAPDTASLEAALDRMGLIPIKVKAISAILPGLPDIRGFFRKPPEEEIILFSRQLATLFAAGVPLTKALVTLEGQTSAKEFAVVIKKVREDIEGGSSFSAALARHPLYFTELYSNMAAAGEAGGILESVLDRLAFMLEKNAENRAKVKSATLYPKIVVGAIVIALVILMNFVVPRFAALYTSFKIELPLPTRILVIISNSILSKWPVMLSVSVLVYASLRLYIGTKQGRRAWDGFILNVPVFGALTRKAILSRFARILGSLYKSGLPILQTLDLLSRAVENKVISAEVKVMQDDVRAGRPLSEPMSKSKQFPPMIVQMVTIGEETGNLDLMLEKTAEYYDREVDSSIRNLTTTLEPALLSMIFVVVLFLALAIFLPMWDIIKIVRR